jgi:hypothetical protein
MMTAPCEDLGYQTGIRAVAELPLWQAVASAIAGATDSHAYFYIVVSFSMCMCFYIN